MKRRAFIIEASEVPGEDVLRGAKADAQAYWKWLYSKPGGDWFESEIVCLHTPTVSEVKKALQAAGKIDYGFVAYSGHGFHSEELDLTKLCLRNGTMTVRDLIPNTDRCTMVVDACRNVMPEIFLESFDLTRNEVTRYAKFAEARNFREDFESLVTQAEKGTIFLYSCDLNESSGESPLGGYFSRFLVEAGRMFADSNEGGRQWLSTKDAFAAAMQYTIGRNKQQHPQYEPGRRREHFPFAV